MTARLFLLTQSPYTRHIASSVDAEVLRSSGFKFIVLDATDLLLPVLRGIHGELALGEEVWRVSTLEDLRKISTQLTTNDIVVFWGAYYDRQLSEPTPVYDIVSKSHALIGAVNSGHIPSHLPLTHDVRSFSTRMARKLSDIAINPSEHVPHLGRQLRRIATSAVRPRSEPALASQGRRPLDYLWTGSMTQPISSSIISEVTQVRFIHTFDYEKIQHEEIHPAEECESLVYLDSMGPLHPDYVAQGNNPFSISSEEYFALIRRSLISLASSSGSDVVIAAHPRASRGSLEGRYGAFPVFYEETPLLIASARAVIDAGGSASIGMAAFAKRPITFLSSRSFGKTTYRGQSDLAHWLRVPIVDIDSPIDKWEIPKVNDDAYATYIHEFLKREDSLPGPFWVQVVEDTLSGLARQGHASGGAP